MSYPQEVKEIAYTLDPDAWVSYSGKPKQFKQYIEGRRAASLQLAMEQYSEQVRKEALHCMFDVSSHARAARVHTVLGEVMKDREADALMQHLVGANVSDLEIFIIWIASIIAKRDSGESV